MALWIKPNPAEVITTWLMGFVGMAAPLAFLIGVLASMPWLMMIGGIVLVVRDVVGVLLGVLSPGFPIILAIILAIFVNPWFVGVFWASAVFALLGLPFHLRQALFPRATTIDAIQAGDPEAALQRIARGG